jgi:hypothetical protein
MGKSILIKEDTSFIKKVQEKIETRKKGNVSKKNDMKKKTSKNKSKKSIK